MKRKKRISEILYPFPQKGYRTVPAVLLIFLCVFLLYHLPAGAVLYPSLLCGALGIWFLLGDVRRYRKKHRQLCRLSKLPGELMEDFPEPEDPLEEDYLEIIRLLQDEQLQTKNEMNRRFEDMMEYYTIWVHQIKTPIASMHLALEKEDSALSRQLSMELGRLNSMWRWCCATCGWIQTARIMCSESMSWMKLCGRR